MGFKKELFQNPSSYEYFLCRICDEVSQEPVECEKCKILFCSECANKNEEKCCPICKMKPKLLKRQVKNIWLDLKMNCQGCKQEMKLGDYLNHQSQCSCFVNNQIQPAISSVFFAQSVTETVIVYSNYCSDCNMKITQSQISTHEKCCDHIMIFCKNIGCAVQIKRKDLEIHMNQECQYQNERNNQLNQVSNNTENLHNKIRSLSDFKNIKNSRKQSEDQIANESCIICEKVKKCLVF